MSYLDWREPDRWLARQSNRVNPADVRELMRRARVARAEAFRSALSRVGRSVRLAFRRWLHPETQAATPRIGSGDTWGHRRSR